MLRQKLARLSSDFASQVFSALRAASLEELSAFAKPSARPPVRKPASAALASTKAASTNARARAPRAAEKVVAQVRAVAAEPDRKLTRAALDFFTARGSRGATVAQVQEHLQAEGANEVVSSLAERGVIRDAGIRRATGKGTAPVFVLSA
jgi:hypothetical protein